MNTDDQYPSTYDAMWRPLPMAGGQDDPVLGTLEGARHRISTGWSANVYIDDDSGEVCAVGAVFAEDGWSEEKFNGDERLLVQKLEQGLTSHAKEAIELLNAAAVEMFPEADEGGWSGPLEWVNQTFDEGEDGDSEDARTAVLAIYDLAISKRQGVPA